MPWPTTDNPRLDDAARAIAAAVLRAADPGEAVRRAWTAELEQARRVVLLASGKAAAAMAEAAIRRLGRRVIGGVITCPPEHYTRAETAVRDHGVPVEVMPADHPLPTERNRLAAKAMADAAGWANENDLVLALISGGASAHLTMPAEGISVEELATLTRAVQRAGATIGELNTVRKHAERLKGGGLARLAWPARVRSLVLSDVLGDPLDVIGSGPTAADPSTFAEALAVLDRYDLRRVSPSVTGHLVQGARGDIPETPKPGDDVLSRTAHTVVASNRGAVEAAAAEARRLGFEVVRVDHGVRGEACEVGRRLGAIIAELAALEPGGANDGELADAMAAEATRRPRCIIAGGETTVTVGDASGVGGRNLELALAAAVGPLAGVADVGLLALATDGVDGPTDAAGALVTGDTLSRMTRAGIDAREALRHHDSLRALHAADAVIRTGPSGTNVNDVAVGFVW